MVIMLTSSKLSRVSKHRDFRGCYASIDWPLGDCECRVSRVEALDWRLGPTHAATLQIHAVCVQESH